MTKYVNEETFFSSLAKLVPFLAIIIRAVMVGDHFFSNVPVLYSYCTKDPFQWRENVDMVTLPIVSVVVFIMSCIGFGMQIVIFVKLKQLESQSCNDNWVVSYAVRGGVNLERLHRMSSHCKIGKHRRNLVSPIGSCASFIASQIWFLVVSYYIFNLGHLGSPIVFDFFLFMTPSMDFLLLNLIETACSPILRESLLSYF